MSDKRGQRRPKGRITKHTGESGSKTQTNEDMTQEPPVTGATTNPRQEKKITKGKGASQEKKKNRS